MVNLPVTTEPSKLLGCELIISYSLQMNSHLHLMIPIEDVPQHPEAAFMSPIRSHSCPYLSFEHTMFHPMIY